MRKNIKVTEAIFPMPVLMVATYNEDGSVDVMNAAWGTMLSRNSKEHQNDEYGCGVIGKVVNVTADEKVMKGENVDISLVDAITFDPYTNGYYRVAERVGNAFKDGLQLKK